MNHTVLDSPQKTGWQAHLSLQYRREGAGTVLRHRHQGPLRVQRPFFPEGPVNHTYLLHPPGGLVGNDALEIDAHVEAGADALITTPGATKAYRNVCDGAAIRQHFAVDGALEWLPQETILFNASRLTSDTTFQLGPHGRLAAWEVQCFGRPVGEQPYESGSADLKLRVITPAGLLLHDRLVLGDDKTVLAAPWGLNGHTALGVMLAYPADETLLDLARAAFTRHEANIAATRIDDLLVVRAVGAQAQTLRRAFVEVWRAIRPALLGRPACEPRIWTT